MSPDGIYSKRKRKIKRSVVSKRRDSSMDVKRVKQILSSSSRIDVTYEGVPVWIESCDEQKGVLKCMMYLILVRAFMWT